MKIIVGLGNPGKAYVNTRHNTGFMILDRISGEKKYKFRKSIKFKSLISRGDLNSGQAEGAWLIKPLTFMNRSGYAVKKIVDTYKVPKDNILVVYDDLDLSLGRIKFAGRGSSAGHKGMDSIIDLLGTDEIPRLKVGISRPPDENAVDYVLSEFFPEEKGVFNQVVNIAVQACADWEVKGLGYARQEYNCKRSVCNG